MGTKLFSSCPAGLIHGLAAEGTGQASKLAQTLHDSISTRRPKSLPSRSVTSKLCRNRTAALALLRAPARLEQSPCTSNRRNAL